MRMNRARKGRRTVVAACLVALFGVCGVNPTANAVQAPPATGDTPRGPEWFQLEPVPDHVLPLISRSVRLDQIVFPTNLAYHTSEPLAAESRLGDGYEIPIHSPSEDTVWEKASGRYPRKLIWHRFTYGMRCAGQFERAAYDPLVDDLGCVPDTDRLAATFGVTWLEDEWLPQEEACNADGGRHATPDKPADGTYACYRSPEVLRPLEVAGTSVSACSTWEGLLGRTRHREPACYFTNYSWMPREWRSRITATRTVTAWDHQYATVLGPKGMVTRAVPRGEVTRSVTRVYHGRRFGGNGTAPILVSATVQAVDRGVGLGYGSSSYRATCTREDDDAVDACFDAMRNPYTNSRYAEAENRAIRRAKIAAAEAASELAGKAANRARSIARTAPVTVADRRDAAAAATRRARAAVADRIRSANCRVFHPRSDAARVWCTRHYPVARVGHCAREFVGKPALRYRCLRRWKV